MASHINANLIVCWIVYSGKDPRKHKSFTSLAFCEKIPQVDSLHKEPVMCFFVDNVYLYYLHMFFKVDSLTVGASVWLPKASE